MKKILFAPVFALLVSCMTGNKTVTPPEIIQTKVPGTGKNFTIEFFKGRSFNHPSLAFWVEDLEENYLETLYVTRFVATGIYGYGEMAPGKWKSGSGEARRPAALPYWSHKRGIKASDGLYTPSPQTAVTDAITTATPKGNFTLETGTSQKLPSKFRLLMEINQPWDSNSFWDNSKYPGDNDYATSLQPALVYAVTIDLTGDTKEYYLNPIGHGNPSGRDGLLYTDITTLTTAKDIAQKVVVHIQ